jgi:hypothetical protein
MRQMIFSLGFFSKTGNGSSKSFRKGLLISSCVILIGATSLLVPIAVAVPAGGWWAALQRVIRPQPPKRKAGGGKGPEAIIAPGIWGNDASGVREVWHLQPVILYQAPQNASEAPDRLRLIDRKTRKVIQDFDVKEKSYAVLSVDTALSPGSNYRIEQLRGKRNRPIANASVDFQVMPEDRRQAIAAKLMPESTEDSSIHAITVFQKYGLWSDVLHQMGQQVTTAEDWQKLQSVILSWEQPSGSPAANSQKTATP